MTNFLQMLSLESASHPPKIALVKSEVYRDLYTDSSNISWRNTILSSVMRTGPAALFTEFDTRFIIIKQDEYATDIWKQKICDCKHGLELDYYDFANKPLVVRNQLSQSDVAISASEIDWQSYDIVIAMDACVSSSITSRFPHALWCYYISEGCMSEYKRSRIRPLEGYQVFLNQRFRHESDYINDPNCCHEIDFPYHLMSYQTISMLLANSSSHGSIERNGIFIDKDTRSLLTDYHRSKLEEIAPLVEAGGQIQALLSSMFASKYYLRLGDRAVWGNASIEAVSSGLLFISSSRGYRNRIFGGVPTIVTGIAFSDDQFDDALLKLTYFEHNEDHYREAVLADRRICSRVCLELPMQQLLSKWRLHASI